MYVFGRWWTNKQTDTQTNIYSIFRDKLSLIMPLTDGNNVDEDRSSNSRMAFG